jgi:hypothetical protein
MFLLFALRGLNTMESRPHNHPLPLDYAPASRRWNGLRWKGAAEITAIFAAIGTAGALVALVHDFVRDFRGWATNDVLVLSLFVGAFAAVASLTCFAIWRLLTGFAFSRRSRIAIVVDGLVLVMLGAWICKSAGLYG